MTDNLQRVKEKVQSILTSNFTVGLDRDGDFTIRHESAQGYVRCWQPEGAEHTIVRVEAPVLFGVQATPELFKHVALHAGDYVFGHLYAEETSDGIMLLYGHSLLGDYLDEQELLRAVGGVIGTANNLDDELQGMFGGKRFHEE